MRRLTPFPAKYMFSSGSTNKIIKSSIGDMKKLLENRSIKISYKTSGNSHEVKLLPPYQLKAKSTNHRKPEVSHIIKNLDASLDR